MDNKDNKHSFTGHLGELTLFLIPRNGENDTTTFSNTILISPIVDDSGSPMTAIVQNNWLKGM